jgi:hypothetical protein
MRSPKGYYYDELPANDGSGARVVERTRSARATTVRARSVPSSAADPSLPPEPGDTMLSRRAQANVESWRSYLPADCVDTMIRMGWHHTT